MSISRTFVHSVVASDDPLNNTILNSGHLTDLCAVLAASGKVRGLGIRGFYITRGACAELAMSIRNLSKRTLQLLDLSCCTVGDVGATQVVRSLAETSGEVRELALRLCHLTPAFCKDVAKIFQTVQARRSSGLEYGRQATEGRTFANLRALDLSFNCLMCSGVAPLLRAAPSGLQLDLSHTGLGIDACSDGDGLAALELALNETEASSVILLGAGPLVTEHLRRARALSHARKLRQQVCDAKCIVGRARQQGEGDGVAADAGAGGGEGYVGAAEAGIIETVGVPDQSSRPDLQWCRPGSASVTLFLDGDVERMPAPDQFVATSEYLLREAKAFEARSGKRAPVAAPVSTATATAAAPPAAGAGGALLANVAADAAPWTARLLSELVTVTGEPLFSLPSYRHGREYPAFVRGEIAGVNRVRDGRGSGPALFSARSASCCSMMAPATSRSASARGSERTAAAAVASRSASALSRSASAFPPAGGVALAAPFGRSNSVVASSVMSHLPEMQQQYCARTPFALASAPPTISASSKSRFLTARSAALAAARKKKASEETASDATTTAQEKQQPADFATSSPRKTRETVFVAEDEKAAENQQQTEAQQAAGDNESESDYSHSNSQRRISSVHLSPRGVVSAGRVLTSLNAPSRALKQTKAPDNNAAMLKRLLQCAAVSDSQAERIFGWPVKKYLLPNAAELPPTMSAERIPAQLLAAHGVPSHLAKHSLGSEARVAGLAKILFFLVFSSIPLMVGPFEEFTRPGSWIADSGADLPEFLRTFGDDQRTVVKFRSQRLREDAAAREVVTRVLGELQG